MSCWTRTFVLKGIFLSKRQVVRSYLYCNWGQNSTLTSGGSEGRSGAEQVAEGPGQLERISDGVQGLGETRINQVQPNLCNKP